MLLGTEADFVNCLKPFYQEYNQLGHAVSYYHIACGRSMRLVPIRPFLLVLQQPTSDNRAMPNSTSLRHEIYADEFIREILTEVKTIALVGLSAEPTRPSRCVFDFLQKHGYRMVGVNPGLAGRQVLGAPVYARLADIPFPIDMVDIFRNSAAAGLIVDEALALSPKPKVIWMQLDVRNDEAAQKAEAQNLKVVMNRCPKIEYERLM